MVVVNRAVVGDLLERSRLSSFVSHMDSWSGILVLNYHRVGHVAGALFDRGLWSATPDDFVRQIRFCRSKLDVISIDDLPTAIESRRGRYVLLTFDDGYRDNYEIAFPILKAAQVPAVFFVCTGFIDKPSLPWWDQIAFMVRTSGCDKIELPAWFETPIVFDEPDREEAVRTLLRLYKATPGDLTSAYLDAIADATKTRPGSHLGEAAWMTWEMLREMNSCGMTIGGHTVSHPVLARSSRERQQEEILGCRRRLAAEVGVQMRYFSYPVGGKSSFDAVTRECLKEAGVQYAFSYYGGFCKFSRWDDYDVRRFGVEMDLADSWFRSAVSMPRFFAG